MPDTKAIQQWWQMNLIGISRYAANRNVRTARPNAQAAALILMVRKFPDTLEKLSALGDQAA